MQHRQKMIGRCKLMQLIKTPACIAREFRIHGHGTWCQTRCHRAFNGRRCNLLTCIALSLAQDYVKLRMLRCATYFYLALRNDIIRHVCTCEGFHVSARARVRRQTCKNVSGVKAWSAALKVLCFAYGRSHSSSKSISSLTLDFTLGV